MNAMISLADLHVVHDEPRVRDLRIAESLGFGRPRDIRKLIARSSSELERYGAVCATVAQTSPKGGRPTKEYHLNEGQALLVCMFSETEKAADVRQQLIEVFMAWRRGQMAPGTLSPTPSDPVDAAFGRMVERLAAVEAALGFDRKVDDGTFAESVTHLPVWKNGRRPRWWSDIEVRRLLTGTHRQVTIQEAVTMAVERFGRKRAPSVSSVHRYWMVLDTARGRPVKTAGPCAPAGLT